MAVRAEYDNDISMQATLRAPSKGCTKKCSFGFKCEEKPCMCQVCVKEPLSCETFKCRKGHRCEDTPGGPRCIQITCADISCEAGFICNDMPEGPDCVPDIPSCKNFYCRRGTNCYIRDGSPTCLPNTCLVRECLPGLSCIDTPVGALCRRGPKKHRCISKYCPENSICQDHKERGPVCTPI